MSLDVSHLTFSLNFTTSLLRAPNNRHPRPSSTSQKPPSSTRVLSLRFGLLRIEAQTTRRAPTNQNTTPTPTQSNTEPISESLPEYPNLWRRRQSQIVPLPFDVIPVADSQLYKGCESKNRKPRISEVANRLKTSDNFINNPSDISNGQLFEIQQHKRLVIRDKTLTVYRVRQ